MEITTYRLVKENHMHAAFDGEGARRYGGRWNSKGVPMVYTSESLALCSLEIFVHLPTYDLLKGYFYIRVVFDADLVLTAQVKEGWNARPISKISQSIGDQWVKEKQSPVLKVPSVIMPDGNNYLLNVKHPDFEGIKIGAAVPLSFDPRFKK